MRYLGNKTKLLSFIDNVIQKYDIKGSNFVDLFAGTGSVGDYFKDRYSIISNDCMYFSRVLAAAKIRNSSTPMFEKFRKEFGTDFFQWLNSREYAPQDNYFIYQTYTPIGGRMYFTEENAIRIDGMRLDVEELYKNNLLSEDEYLYAIASLLESVLRVSNTSGTYQAFFKFWESRATKKLVVEPLEMKECNHVNEANQAFCRDANELARELSGDIVYIDPPYTITQYSNSYHILETIARYDYPVIFGKTGRRRERILSGYSNKSHAIEEFEDLFRQLDFEHVLISYSNQSIVSLEELVKLARLFAVDNEVHVEKLSYREYSSNNPSYKDDGEGLKEAILYFRKDRAINKSPLNYSGSKDAIVPAIVKLLPKHIDVFVDAMGGAFNVGANVIALDKVVYNEYNARVFEIVQMLLSQSGSEIIKDVDNLVSTYGLKKKSKTEYLKLRDDYNNGNRSPLVLYTLQIYAFQNMIRFNGSGQMNTPIGNNEFNEGTRERLMAFRVKSPSFELVQGKFEELDWRAFPKGTLFYFDPPYFITKAEYNDGKRGLEGWNVDKETGLLEHLVDLDRAGYKFMLSNVLKHNGKEHHILIEWIAAHGFSSTIVGSTGIKYPRVEVIVRNY